MAKEHLNLDMDDVEKTAEGIGMVGTILSGVALAAGAVIGLIKLLSNDK